jgi:hypothetical protein
VIHDACLFVRRSPCRPSQALLKEAKTSTNEQTKQVGQWAHTTLFAAA